MAKRGRPTKLVKERVDRFLDFLRAGNYIETSCLAAGFSVDSYHHYLDLAENNKVGIYHDFAVSVKKAEAEAEARNVALIALTAKNTWQAAAWLLERKYPEKWAMRNKTELTGKDGGPIQVEVDAKTKLFGIIAHGATRIRDSEEGRQALTAGSSGNTLRLDSVGTPESKPT